MNQPTTLLSAVPVPFEANGDLDVKGQETLLRHLKVTGIGGVFISGTTGEFTALDDDERAVVLSAALEVYGADAVYVHVGAAAARQAERLTAQAITFGARRLAAITPFYLPAGPAALIDYYRRLDAVAGDARIYVYLFAARTGSTVTPDQLAELAMIPSVVGAKISGEPTSRVLQYVRAVPDDFEVYSGNDIEFGDFVRAGGTGAVSGVSSVFPRPFLDLADALKGATTRRPPRRRTASNRPSRPSAGPTSRCSRQACHFKAYRQARPGWPSTSQLPRSWRHCAPQSRN